MSFRIEGTRRKWAFTMACLDTTSRREKRDKSLSHQKSAALQRSGSHWAGRASSADYKEIDMELYKGRELPQRGSIHHWSGHETQGANKTYSRRRHRSQHRSQKRPADYEDTQRNGFTQWHSSQVQYSTCFPVPNRSSPKWNPPKQPPSHIVQ